MSIVETTGFCKKFPHSARKKPWKLRGFAPHRNLQLPKMSMNDRLSMALFRYSFSLQIDWPHYSSLFD